jgi:DNA-binding CsgD family transcriptional regulator
MAVSRAIGRSEDARMTPFVGRQAELALLRRSLDHARAGTPHIVQIQGPAGVGKTALVNRLLASFPDVAVLRASGDESEQLLDHGVIEQLAGAAGPAGGVLLRRQPGTDDAAVDDNVAVGTQVLRLIESLTSDGPLVLVLDDVQWFDLASLKALIFALRRLVADQVLTVAVVREEAVPLLPESLRRLVDGHRGTTLQLDGLHVQDLSELAGAMGVSAFPAHLAHRFWEGTRGNALHATALLEEFPPDGWGGPDEPLPSPRSFRLLVQDRYAAVSPPARQLVDAAAVLGHCSLLETAGRLGRVPDPVQALDEADRHDLLHPAERTRLRAVQFPHPLVRAAVYDSLGAARRGALHTAAAGMADDERAILRHRTAAASTPDGTLAGDLASFAAREFARGAWPSAVGHLVMAGRVDPDPATGRKRILRAVNWMLFSGDVTQAARFADEITAFPHSPLRDSVLGYLAAATQEPETAEILLGSAWRHCSEDGGEDGGGRELAATVALQNALHFYGRLDGRATVEWGRRAVELAIPGSPKARSAQTYLAFGLGYAGRADEAMEVVADADPAPHDESHGWLMPRAARGLLRLVDDDLDGARIDLAAVAAAGSRTGMLHAAAIGNAGLARAEYLAGMWDDAMVHAERAAAILEESDYSFVYSVVHGTAALVPAARGDRAAADSAVRAALCPPGGYERLVVSGAVAQAQVAAARADPRRVLAALEPVRRLADRDAVGEPGFWPWQGLYAEALVACNRLPEADSFLLPHETLAAERGRASMVARLASARAGVAAAAGRDEDADAAFDRAIAAIGPLGMPFEQALVELAHGRFLRRTGRRRPAAVALDAALHTFSRLGAAPYVRRCENELAAAGLDIPNRHRDLVGLTSQEMVVAALVAAGMTNREVAAELVVSVKTVEFHLRNAFQKLGVSSRKQLSARMSEVLAH